MSAAASSREVAIGFSTSTCLPASSAALASGPCSGMLVSTSTTSTSSFSITASALGQARVDAEPLAGRAALALVDVVDRRDAGAAAAARRSIMPM